MQSITEIRKISLRNLHRSATQHWEKHNGSTNNKKFVRTASTPAISFQNVELERVGNSSLQNDIEKNEYFESQLHTSFESQYGEDDRFSENTDNFQSIAFGFQTRSVYVQHSKMTDIMDVLYNGRTHSFFLLDSRGISSWQPGSDDLIKRAFSFPKYKIKLLRSLIYCRKYNVYFTVCSDFTLKVYNRDFHATCETENKSMRSILHLIFNPVTDELISSGVAGTVVWKYKQVKTNLFDKIKPMANWELDLHAEYPHIGGTWCTKLELITSAQYLFYCSETDLYAYDAGDMRKLFSITNAHNSALTCVAFSSVNRTLVTGSVDTEVKVWGATGGHICTWRGHSRAISSIIIHPDIPGLVFSSSLDGTIKVWSLYTMDLFYSLSLFSEGIFGMNVTDEGFFWCSNPRKITVLKFHPVVSFWGHTRCRINELEVLEHPGKTTRLMALGEDGSVRLFSQSRVNSSALCTVLPPPIVSLLDNVRDVTHSRFNHLFFVLINPTKIWIYTAKTDPACRIAEWDISTILKEGVSFSDSLENAPVKSLSSMSLSGTMIRNFEEKRGMHECTQILTGKTSSSACCCVLAVYSENGFQYHSPVGLCSSRSRNLLLLGLEDGRVIFVDQKHRGLLYCELQVNKEPVVSIKHERQQNWFITQCNNAHSVTYQIWKLPDITMLHTIQSNITTTCYAIFENTLVTGHSTGHVNVHYIGNGKTVYDKDDRHPEHKTGIIDVKSCKKQGVFCSCSEDGVIRLWNLEKVLLCDIQLGEDLSCCNFLNDRGDLIIGWKRHLFVIDHETMLLRSSETDELSDNFEEESDIYEDPSVRYESSFRKSNKSNVITMKNYLVPYGFVATDSNEALDLEFHLDEIAESEHSDNSEATLCAMTDTYLSPATSMESFGIIDALFPQKSKINEQKVMGDLMFPEFGTSPGSTPVESVISSSEDNDIDDDMQEVADTLSNVGKPVDLKEKLSIGVLVAKAIKKMNVKKDETSLDQPTKSRFADATLDSRNLMKKGMNVAFAVGSLQKEKKSASSSNKPSMKNHTKKTRRPSTANSKRKSLVPTEIPLQPLQVDDDGSVGDSDSIGEGYEFNKKDLDIKLTELGMKMTTHHKVDSILSKYPQPTKFNSLNQRRKQANMDGSAKPNIHLGNKLKRKASKSANVRRRRPSIGKSDNQFKYSGNNVPDSSLPGNLTANWLSQMSKNQGRNILHAKINDTDEGSISATNNMNSLLLPDSTKLSDSGLAIIDKILEENTVSDVVKISTESDGHTVSSSNNFIKQLNEDEIRKLSQIDEKQELEAIIRMKGNKDDDSADEDEFTIPNLLEFDFHAIYKKDGLQFDEKWQDRMLERYLLLKLQKEQRHEAAMNKRIYLEQERQFRLIASQPDIFQKYNEPWYEDHAVLANYILNSKLMKGESPTPDALFHDNNTNRPDSQLSKRTTSVASNYRNGGENRDKTFRFSIRSKSCDDNSERMNMLPRRARNPSTLLPLVPTSSHTSMKSRNSSLSQKYVTDRPRSSTSIPGKTRYILVKPENERKPEKGVSLTKLEESLLRKRFPSQHQCVMKSLGRLDEMQLSDTNFCSTGYNQSPYDQFNSRLSTASEYRKIQTVPSDGSRRISNKGHKSEMDAFPTERKLKSFSSVVENSETPDDYSWKNASSNIYINPLDIVKRKSSIKFAAKSVHV